MGLRRVREDRFESQVFKCVNYTGGFSASHHVVEGLDLVQTLLR